MDHQSDHAELGVDDPFGQRITVERDSDVLGALHAKGLLAHGDPAAHTTIHQTEVTTQRDG